MCRYVFSFPGTPKGGYFMLQVQVQADASSPDVQGFETSDLLPLQHWTGRKGTWLWVLGSWLARLAILHEWNRSSSRARVSPGKVRWRMFCALTILNSGLGTCLIVNSKVVTRRGLPRQSRSSVSNRTLISSSARPLCTTYWI
jgi:hypothetical protein